MEPIEQSPFIEEVPRQQGPEEDLSLVATDIPDDTAGFKKPFYLAETTAELLAADTNHPETSEEFQGEMAAARDTIDRVAVTGPWPDYARLFERQREQRKHALNQDIDDYFAQGDAAAAEATIEVLKLESEREPTRPELRMAATEEALTNLAAAIPDVDLTDIDEKLHDQARIRAAGTILDDRLIEMIDELTGGADVYDYLEGFLNDITPSAWRSSVLKYLEDETKGDETLLGFLGNVMRPASVMSGVKHMRALFLTMDEDELNLTLDKLKEANFGFWGLVNNPLATVAFLESMRQYKTNQLAWDVTFGLIDTTMVADVGWLVNLVRKGARNSHVLGRSFGKKKAGEVITQSLKQDAPVDGLSAVGRAESTTSTDTNKYMTTDAVRGASADVQQRLVAQNTELAAALEAELRAAGTPPEEIEKILGDWSLGNHDPAVNEGIRNMTLADGDRAGSVYYVNTNTGEVFETEAEATKWALEHGMSPNEFSVVHRADAGTSHMAPAIGDLEVTADEAAQAAYTQERAARMADLENAEDTATKVGPGDRAQHKDDLEDAIHRANSNASEMLMGNDAIHQVMMPKVLDDIYKDIRAELTELLVRVRKMSDSPEEIGAMYDDMNRIHKDVQQLREAQLAVQTKKVSEARKALGANAGDEVITSPDLARAKPMVQEMKKIFGLQGDVVIVSEHGVDTIPGLRNMFEGFNARIKAGKTRGTAFTVRQKGGPSVHAVILKSAKQTPIEQATTLLHELGHSFMNEMLIPGSVASRTLHEDFMKWVSKRGDSLHFRKWLAERNGATWLKPHAKKFETGEFPLSMDELTKQSRAWQLDFKEYFADAFQKFALTSRAPRSAIEKTYASIIAKVEEAYKYIMKTMGLDASQPRAAAKAFFEDHIARIESGQDVQHVDEFLTDMDFTKSPTRKDQLLDRLQDHVDDEVADSTGFTVKQTLSDNYLGPYVPLGWDLKGLSTIGNKLVLDPRSTVAPELYDAVVASAFRAKAVKRAIDQYLKPFLKGRSKQNLRNVENLLQRGDQFKQVNGVSVGKEFTWAETLQEGLNVKEAETYMAVRNLRAVFHRLRDRGMVSSLQRGGYKQVGLKLDGNVTQSFWGRSVDWANSAGEIKDKLIWDNSLKENVRMTDELIGEYIDNNAILIQAKGEVQITDNGVGASKYIIIKDADDAQIKEIQSALGYRKGEMSRIYDDEYFITQSSTPTVDGIKAAEPSSTVIRTARTSKEAGQFADDMNNAVRLARAHAAGRSIGGELKDVLRSSMKTDAVHVDRFVAEFQNGAYDDVAEYGWKYNRSVDEYVEDAVELAHTTGGQFSGKRGPRLKRAFAHRVGEEKQILDPWRSLAAESMNISRFITTAEVRETAMIKWVATFDEIIPAVEKVADDPIQTFFNVIDHEFGKARGDRMGYLADANKSYLKSILGQPDEWERKAGHVMRALTEDMGLDYVAPAAVGRWIRNAKPLDFFRALAFDVNLGLFNPAQLFVQANGMFVSAAAHPVHGLKAAFTMPLVRIALMSDNPAVWKQVAKFEKLAKLGLSSEDEFVDIVRSIKDTGLLADLTSTAFHTSTGGGGLSINDSVVGKLRKMGRIPYNRGEEATRMMAWDVARRVWMKDNPGQAFSGTAAQKTIMARADDLMLNMTEVNKAAWQKGPLALPFQFLQYNFKLVNQVGRSMFPGLKSNFTPAQATRMFGAHLLFYGAAGTGILNAVPEVLGWWMGEDEINALPTATKLGLAQGLFSQLLYSLTADEDGKGGTALAIGTRLGAGEFYERLIESVLDGGGGAMDVLTGPSGANLKKFYTSFEKAMMLTRSGGTSLATAPTDVVGIISDTISTTRSATKAYMWYAFNKQATDSRLNKTGDVTNLEIIGRVVGFEPQINVDTWEFFDSKREHEAALKEIATTVNQLYKDSMYWQGVAVRGGLTDTDIEKNVAMQTSNNRMAAANTILANLPVGDMFKVRTFLKNEMQLHDSQFNKLYTDLFFRADKYDMPFMPTNDRVNDSPEILPEQD